MMKISRSFSGEKSVKRHLLTKRKRNVRNSEREEEKEGKRKWKAGERENSQACGIERGGKEERWQKKENSSLADDSGWIQTARKEKKKEGMRQWGRQAWKCYHLSLFSVVMDRQEEKENNGKYNLKIVCVLCGISPVVHLSILVTWMAEGTIYQAALFAAFYVLKAAMKGRWRGM